MEPEVFLEQRDVIPLIKIFIRILSKITTIDRHSILKNAGVDSALIGNLRLESPSNVFAQTLVAEFKRFRINNSCLDYHPMVNFLKYLIDFSQIYNLSGEEKNFFIRLVQRGEENFKALKARSGVGRIEFPQNTCIGTGVLVSRHFILTCYHVFHNDQIEKAWVRFNYKPGNLMLDIDLFELDLNFVSYCKKNDYALLRINGEPRQQIVHPVNSSLDAGQKICLIHHPLGEAVVISDIDRIIQVGEDYIDHSISADNGSSGAPIFNRQWELVAIHQGHPGIGRSITKGALGGIPIRTIWHRIKPYLPEIKQGVF